MPLSIKIEQFKRKVSGVCEARLLSHNEDGVKEESMAVLLYFKLEVLPDRVLEYCSYPVRAFVPTALTVVSRPEVWSCNVSV